MATGSLQATKITAATGVHWSRANRLLYRVGIEGPLLYGKAKGIYEADMSVNPPAERLVFAHISRIKTFEDVAPTLSCLLYTSWLLTTANIGKIMEAIRLEHVSKQ